MNVKDRDKFRKLGVNINMIMAHQNNVIGCQTWDEYDYLPWSMCRDDMMDFKSKTSGSIVVMGRKTFESILLQSKTRQPLDNNRLHIVYTSTPNELKEHYGDFNGMVQFVNGHEDAFDYINCFSKTHNNTIFIIGGYQTYVEWINVVDTLYITEIPSNQPSNKKLDGVKYKSIKIMKRFRDQIDRLFYKNPDVIRLSSDEVNMNNAVYQKVYRKIIK